MCGLLAYFSTDADRVDDDTVMPVRDAQHCMRHRGPDENESWSDSRAVFGFNRLSFIDIEHSHQPMPYADGRYRIVFNGEIYNYLELREELAAEPAPRSRRRATPRRSSPGFHLWGEDVVPRLRGMFAFVIWDTHTGTVFGARDPSVSSRCSPRAWPMGGSLSPPRRRPCSSCSAAARPPAASTRRPCSTT